MSKREKEYWEYLLSNAWFCSYPEKQPGSVAATCSVFTRMLLTLVAAILCTNDQLLQKKDDVAANSGQKPSQLSTGGTLAVQDDIPSTEEFVSSDIFL